MNKPEKDIHYLTQCFVIAMRSLDPDSKYGSIIVSKDGRPLSSGYNGPIKGSKDDEIPLTRPEKYFHMIHSEENAILAYNGSYQDILGATIYVSGKPCHVCMRMIIQKGIKEVVYPKFPLAKCQDDEDITATKLMLKHHKDVKVREINCIGDIMHLLDDTEKYICNKLVDNKKDEKN